MHKTRLNHKLLSNEKILLRKLIFEKVTKIQMVLFFQMMI